MASHNVVTTDAQIDQALARASRVKAEPRLIDVLYTAGPELDLYILRLADGRRIAIPREDLEGLSNASTEQLKQVEITANGLALRWPALDLDVYLPNLLKRIYGTKAWMAQLGAKGGAARTSIKRTASRNNGKKGGRPRLIASGATE